MPNHILTVIKIEGAKKDFLKLLNTVKSNEKDKERKKFDFNKIIPIPPVLIGTRSPLYAPNEKSTEEIKKQYERQLKIREVLGYDNWYHWSTENWGTKWNAYDVHISENEKRIEFNTAWSHPDPIIKVLSLMFPDLNFIVKFADEDIYGENHSSYTIKDGIKEEEELTNLTQFAKELWNIEEDDEN